MLAVWGVKQPSGDVILHVAVPLSPGLTFAGTLMGVMLYGLQPLMVGT